MITSKYLLGVLEGTGRLKSMLNRSIGFIAFINVPCIRRLNFGFTSAQILQEDTTRLTSVVEYGRFFVRTKCSSLVTPG